MLGLMTAVSLLHLEGSMRSSHQMRGKLSLSTKTADALPTAPYIVWCSIPDSRRCLSESLESDSEKAEDAPKNIRRGTNLSGIESVMPDFAPYRRWIPHAAHHPG